MAESKSHHYIINIIINNTVMFAAFPCIIYPLLCSEFSFIALQFVSVSCGGLPHIYNKCGELFQLRTVHVQSGCGIIDRIRSS